MEIKVIHRPSGDSVFIKSKAKINLSLDVTGKRPDGYHTVEMIMQTISLYDEIYIVKTITPDDISIFCTSRYVPSDSRNIVWKAAKLIFDEFPELTAGFGVHISIKKNIPVAAGLAGGSGNGAAVLLGMNRLFNINLPKDKLLKLGSRLGADVPFCIQGGTMLAKGIGEELTVLPRLSGVPILLVNPNKPLSTGKVYSALKLDEITHHPDTEMLVRAVHDKDVDYIAKNTVNVLEGPAVELMPEISKIKSDLINSGALGAIMSGSGPTVFGVFQSQEQAMKAFKRFKKNKNEYKCYIAQTI